MKDKMEGLLTERGYLLQKINQYAGRGDFFTMRKYLDEFEKNEIERGRLEKNENKE
jgi:hypothetical protein